jgi:hypothetical protein
LLRNFIQVNVIIIIENDVNDSEKPVIRKEFKIVITVTGKWILKPLSNGEKGAGGTENDSTRSSSGPSSGNSNIFVFYVCTEL